MPDPTPAIDADKFMRLAQAGVRTTLHTADKNGMDRFLTMTSLLCAAAYHLRGAGLTSKDVQDMVAAVPSPEEAAQLRATNQKEQTS